MLATLNGERFPGHPTIPTITESGGPNIDIVGWFGLSGPAGLPPEIVRKIETACRTLMTEEASKIMVTAGLRPNLLGSAGFTSMVASDLKRYADIKNRAHMQVD